MAREDKWIVLSPAFGRDYQTKAEVLTAFDSGADFTTHTPRGFAGYTSKSELRIQGYTKAQIRYQLQTKITVASI